MWQAVIADVIKLISHLVFLRHPHHISFNSFFSCFCQNKLKPFFFLKKKICFLIQHSGSGILILHAAAFSQQVRVMTGSDGRPKPGWYVLCLHPVASCHCEHMGGEIAIHWLYTNNLFTCTHKLSKTTLDWKLKSMYWCFVWVTHS